MTGPSGPLQKWMIGGRRSRRLIPSPRALAAMIRAQESGSRSARPVFAEDNVIPLVMVSRQPAVGGFADLPASLHQRPEREAGEAGRGHHHWLGQPEPPQNAETDERDSRGGQVHNSPLPEDD